MEDLILRAETAGGAAEAAATITVMVGGDPGQARSVDYYTLKRGWKLLLKAVELEADAATRVRIRAGPDSTSAAANPVVVSRYLSSAGQLDTWWREPVAVKALSGDLYVWITFEQPGASTGAASVTVVAAQAEVE